MKRLTQRHWRIINAALAMYEAGELDDEAEAHELGLDEWRDQLAETRERVWERVKD